MIMCTRPMRTMDNNIFIFMKPLNILYKKLVLIVL